MIVFTYPGQGSQKPQMGEPWVDHPSWELVEEASSAASRDVAELLLHASIETLTETRNAQLATFTMSMVVLDALIRVGVEAAGHAGHSLGEYSALTASGALDYRDAVKLVAERGEAMQAAADGAPGTMAAILGLDDDVVDACCHRVGGGAWVANFNAPGQVVIGGTPEGVGATIALCKERAAKRTMQLTVGGAFHTPLMAGARDRLAKAIDQADIRPPEGIVVANVDGMAHDVASEWSGLLNAQLCSPVRWRQTLHTLDEAGFTIFIELGPGKVLTGLAKRTLPDATRHSVSSPEHLDALLEVLAGEPAVAIGQHEGEHLFATERLVVSHRPGVFDATGAPATGTSIAAGDIVGRVGEDEVRSPFAGELMGYLAVEGERVMTSQPILWLRVDS